MKQLLTLLLLSILLASSAFAQTKEIIYATDTTVTANPAEARFQVDSLKYEPYPVNPGESFDLWIKVENIGMAAAENAQFELIQKYPFTPTDPVRSYGQIRGAGSSANAENQVVIHYRVKVADDAPSGTSTINFRATTTGTAPSTIEKTLPIELGRTKTDFAVVMQGFSDQGISFAIANIGARPATAVTVRILDQETYTTRGPREAILGNLDKGDFTTVTFQLTPRQPVKTIPLEISYTDQIGVRNILQKTVAVDISPSSILGFDTTPQYKPPSPYTPWIYGTIGLLVGIIILTIIQKRRKRRP